MRHIACHNQDCVNTGAPSGLGFNAAMDVLDTLRVS